MGEKGLHAPSDKKAHPILADLTDLQAAPRRRAVNATKLHLEKKIKKNLHSVGISSIFRACPNITSASITETNNHS
jgi:hypothetical protein